VETPHISENKKKRKRKFKSQASAGNVMLPLFWDYNGPILEYHLEQGTNVTAAS
jgi:hypothetical protein